MFKVSFTCFVNGSVSYWYQETGLDLESLKKSARESWNTNRGDKKFLIYEIALPSMKETLIEEYITDGISISKKKGETSKG